MIGVFSLFHIESEGEYQYALDDLKEYWAFWLEKNNF